MDPEPISLILFLSSFSITSVLSFLLLFVLLFFSALISGAEVAIFSLNKTDLEDVINDKQIAVLSKLLERPKKLLATILVANNFINIAVVMLFAYLGDIIFSSIESELVKFILEVVLITFLILLFGEILPKIYASRNSLKFAKFMAIPLNVLDFLFSPLSLPMRSITLGIHNKLGKQKVNLSVDQLSQALELTDDEDTSEEEQKILQGIVSFGNTDTKQVMRPRIDIFALSIDDDFNKILPEIIDRGYSRIPVYKESVDDVKGILYVKDLLPYINKTFFNWTTLLREPFFVPENKKLDDLMAEFQERKVHLAVVVDEYGGTSGMITVEDIVEELFGEIEDEHDNQEFLEKKISDTEFNFSARLEVDYLNEEYSLNIPKSEAYETLGGFIIEHTENIPKENEVVDIEYFEIKILKMSSAKIEEVRLKIIDEDA